MLVPSPPWRLRGPCAIVPALVGLAEARAAAPAGVRVLPVSPGLTLGGVLLGDYRAGSTLEYRELIAFAGLGARGRRAGLLVADIAVDLDASVRGGRDFWRLPKVLARFDGDLSAGELSVTREDGAPLLRLRAAPPAVHAPVPLLATFLGVLDGGRSAGLVHGVLRGGPARARLELPEGGPLDRLGLRPAPVGLVGRADVLAARPRRGGR